jgi:hypothetical protein
MAGNFDSSPRSEERCNLHELQCFKKVLEIATQPVMDNDASPKRFRVEADSSDDHIVASLDLMTGALPLLHKYDCSNAVHAMQSMLVLAFPMAANNIPNAYGTVANVTPLAKWLNQSHLNFAVSLQEFFGPDALTIEMKSLLAGCLVNPGAVTWAPKPYSIVLPGGVTVRRVSKKQTLKVQFTKPANAEVFNEETLLLEAFKITGETYSEIFAKGLHKTTLVGAW